MGAAGVIIVYFVSNIQGRQRGGNTKENEIVIRLNAFFYKFIKICTIFFSIFGLLGIIGIFGGLYKNFEDILWIIEIFVIALIFWCIWAYFKTKMVIIKSNKMYLHVLWKKYEIIDCSDIKKTKNKLVFYKNKKKITTITPIYEGYSDIIKWIEEQSLNFGGCRMKGDSV